MEIVNQTCYNTEDLRDLWNRVKVAYQEEVEGADDPAYWRDRFSWKDPARLIIGYFKNRDLRHDHYAKYTSVRQKPAPRLGIVKKGDMPWGHALTAIANAATGKEMSIPPRAIKHIISAMIELAGGYVRLPSMPYVDGEEVPHYYDGPHEGCWLWIEDVTIRFNERAKRGSRKAAARARKLCKIDQLHKEIVKANAAIAQQQLVIEQHQAEVRRLEQKMAVSLAAVEAAEKELKKE